MEAKTKGIINDKENEYLNIKHPRIPVIYYLPKVHKDINNPPPRPIVSGINSITHHVSAYIDKFLQKHVLKMKSYLRDSQCLITILKDIKINENIFLCTCDVSSLYTFIPHEPGIQAIDQCLQKDEEMPAEQRAFILNSIRYCLTHNYFWFEKKYCNQCTGTAKGAKFAPSYTNLYMEHWEEEYLYSSKNPFQRYLALYRRYIDDCFII